MEKHMSKGNFHGEVSSKETITITRLELLEKKENPW